MDGLLSHQQLFQQHCRDMKTSTALRLVLALTVCGGGKSIYPVIAAHELIPTIADGVCWVSPRNNLRVQGEGNFLDRRIRRILGHSLEIRTAINEKDPMRDKVGYTTCYQSLVTALPLGAANPHLMTFQQKKMILFLDEPPHMFLNGAYHKAVDPLLQRAAVVIMAGGHLSRADNQPVAYLNYLEPDSSGKRLVDLSATSERRIVRYSIREATRERQLIEIKFDLRDAGASWEVETDNGVEAGTIDSFDDATKQDTARGLFTALKTEFADDLLIEAAIFWRSRKRNNPRSKLLVVCTSIKQANDVCLLLRRRLGLQAEVAHSDESEAATSAILGFRGKQMPEVDILVTVNMAYEGLDCPQADVLVCLTRIRSREWIEQMLHRVTRYDRDGLPWERQFATIFAPKDRFFLEIMNDIKEQQAPYLVDLALNDGPGGGGPSPSNGDFIIRAIESEIGPGAAFTLDGAPIAGDEHTKLNEALRAADLDGAWPLDKAKRFYDEMNGATTKQPSALASDEKEPDPPSKQERDWKKKIEDYKRSDYRSTDPYSKLRFERRGKAIWRMYKKPINELTVPQLIAVWNARSIWMNVG